MPTPRKKKNATPLTLQEQAEKLLQEAEEKNVQTNFFFRTTFKRYQVQLRILSDLERTIAEDGPLVTKEYVKGRGNTYTHPAITEYNKTATAANNTVLCLIKIIDAFANDGEDTGQGSQSRLDKLLSSMA